MTAEIVLMMLWVIGIGLTEYAKNAVLSENTHALIKAYMQVVLTLRQIKVTQKADKQYYHNNAGKFVSRDAVLQATATGTRILQGIYTTVLGSTGGVVYFT